MALMHVVFEMHNKQLGGAPRLPTMFGRSNSKEPEPEPEPKPKSHLQKIGDS